MIALAVLAAAAVLTGAGAPGTLSGPFGSGPAQVWVLKPNAPIQRIVVFVHGWKRAPPSAAQPWVGQFRPWLDHLVEGGNAVIFPRYQLGGGDRYGNRELGAFEAGLRTGFDRLGRPAVPVAAVGYSVGAALALTYGAEARTWRLPVPVAIDAVFPAAPFPGVRLPRLDPRVRVLIQVGDEDVTAGTAGAAAFWRWLAQHTRKSYNVVRSAGAFHAAHPAPKLTTPAARRAFWVPLDRLIANR
jgi:hypothetical protein